MEETFKLLINDKVYKIKPFKKLMDISSNVRNSFIFNSSHSYRIQSNVDYKIIDQMIKYFEEEEEVPEINLDNIHEYLELSSEFSILEEELERKKREYGSHFINLQGVIRKNIEDKSEYENNISSRLDEYLEQHGEEMMTICIQNLYNIFNSTARKLTNQDRAYELIKMHFERTNDSNILVLLDTLDMNKLSKENSEESISLFYERYKHMPKIDYSIILSLYEANRNNERRIEEIENKYSQQKQETEKLETIINEYEIEKQKTEIKHDEEISILKSTIETLKKEISKKEEEIEEKKQEIEDYKFECETKIIEMKEENKQQEKIIQEQKSKLEKLESETKSFSFCQPFQVDIDKNTPGILHNLKNSERTPFDRLFIASQSSGDIYNLIDPQTNDRFTLCDIGDFIEFELEESVPINGIRIFSSYECFPKSFDIEIDGEKVKSISEAKELNGKYKNLTINVGIIRCRRI